MFTVFSFCWQPVYLRLRLVSEAGRVVCCDNRPLPHVSPLTPLEITDSSNSIMLERPDSPTNLVNSSVSDVIVDFEVGSEIDEEGKNWPKKEKLSFSRLSSEGNIGVDVDLKTHVFKFKDTHPLAEVGETKGYDRYIVKRVQSASFVEVPRVGMLRQAGCRCMSESQSWRARSVSISSRTNTWKSNSRVRLISDSNLQSSLVRLQSHHSSSDEEWFEEVSNDETADDSFGPKKGRSSDTFEVSKIPVLEEISLEEPYEPIQSSEDISIGTVVLDLKTGIKCKNCCPIRCRKKRKLTKSQRNIIRSNSSRNKGNEDDIPVEHRRCCCIS